MNLYSYVVRYDSGFAPNPFYGVCTLATCKPLIRKGAQVGDWIVGLGSGNKKIKQEGRLVYAMQVREILTFNEYFNDARFKNKKPILTGSRKQARGDNIYCQVKGVWRQLDSYHSRKDGTPNNDHIKRDTSVDRVLVSNHYIYFGANGPRMPTRFHSQGKYLYHKGIGTSKFIGEASKDLPMINNFNHWLSSLGESGYVGHPYDWNDSR